MYQERFRTPEYFWFDPDTLELAGFRLQNAKYNPILPNQNNLFWSESLGLFLGIHQEKLRYFSIEGKLVPTPEEAALKAQEQVRLEKQRAELENQRAESEKQRADLLAAKLRELGIELE